MKRTITAVIFLSLMQLGALPTAFGNDTDRGRDSGRADEKNNRHGGSPNPLSPAASPAPAPDGAALYQTYCSGCHGSLATSRVRRKTAAQMQKAIANNVGGMGFLKTLTPAQLEAIATALK